MPEPIRSRVRPRLLAIVQLPPPIHGASLMNEVVVDSTEIRARYDMEVMPLRYARSLDDIGRPTLRKVLVMGAQWLRVLQRALFRRPDVVYYTIAPFGWALARDLCYVSVFRSAGVPIVYHIHGGGIERTARNPILRRWVRWVFHRQVVIHLSPSLVTGLTGLAPPERCRILPNGVKGPCGELRRSTTDEDRSANTILFCSNMMIQKGPLVLVRALGILARNGISFVAEFAGPAVPRDIEVVFWDLCRHEGIIDRVRWTGPRYGQEKAELFSSATIFAFPTLLQEGVPLVILEAMSFGLPSVASNQGGIPDIVEDGVTGFLVPAGDAEALAAKLESLLTHRELRESMGERARACFDERYTLDRFERGLAGILGEALA
jgi:glycosyltransferase involved in cell wall biosynthesis